MASPGGVEFTLFTRDGIVDSLVSNRDSRKCSYRVIELPPQNNNPLAARPGEAPLFKGNFILVGEGEIPEGARDDEVQYDVIFPSAASPSARLGGFLRGSSRRVPAGERPVDSKRPPFPVDAFLGFAAVEAPGLAAADVDKARFREVARALFDAEPAETGLGFSDEALSSLISYGDDDFVKAAFDPREFESPSPGLPPSSPCFAGIYAMDQRVFFVVFGGAAESTREQWAEALRFNADRKTWAAWAEAPETKRLRELSRRCRRAAVDALVGACGAANPYGGQACIDTAYTYPRAASDGVELLYDATSSEDAEGGVLALESDAKDSPLALIRHASGGAWASAKENAMSRTKSVIPRVLARTNLLKQLTGKNVTAKQLRCVYRVDWNE